MVHRRQIEGETLIFGVHGALWGNAMTWWDHDTGSVWSQPLGEAIAGPRKGQTVELLPSQFTTWGAWVEQHPDTLALDAPAQPSGFDLGQMYIVVDFTEEARGYPVEELRGVGVVNDVVAGLEIAVVIDPADPNRWIVLSRRIGETIVELELVGDELRDRVTGATFDTALGQATGDGDLAGMTLGRLPALTSFPGDFDTFWPDSDVWRP
jgi:hypothetical protein